MTPEELAALLGGNPSAPQQDAQTQPQSQQNVVLPPVLADAIQKVIETAASTATKMDDFLANNQLNEQKKQFASFMASNPDVNENDFSAALLEQVDMFKSYGISDEEAKETVAKLFGNPAGWQKLKEYIDGKKGAITEDKTPTSDTTKPNDILSGDMTSLGASLRPKGK